MPGNLFTAVTIRRRSAAHGCATAHPDAHSEGGCPELRTRTIQGLAEDYRANNRVINNLSHTFSTPGNNPERWGEDTTPVEPGTVDYGSGTGSIRYDQGGLTHSKIT